MVERSDPKKNIASSSLPNKQPMSLQLQHRLLQSMDSNDDAEESKGPKPKQRPAAVFAASQFVPLAKRLANNFNKMPTDVFQSELYNPALVKHR